MWQTGNMIPIRYYIRMRKMAQDEFRSPHASHSKEEHRNDDSFVTDQCSIATILVAAATSYHSDHLHNPPPI